MTLQELIKLMIVEVTNMGEQVQAEDIEVVIRCQGESSGDLEVYSEGNVLYLEGEHQ
jgi:hypothetical protein